MALKSIYKIVFKNGVNSGFVADDKVIVYWDTTSTDFIVKKNGTQIYSGTKLGVAEKIDNDGIYTKNYTVSIEPKNATIYQFCDGADLNYFEFSQEFPYAERLIQVNSTFCNTSIVCDLQFEGVAQIVKPSTESATDGQITVTATTSNGTVKYSLQDEDYTDMTNTTGVFTGLGIGEYIVYAKDDYNCIDSLLVVLDADVTYGPLYRIEYDKLNGDVGVIDIEERGYAGAVEEVKGADTPFILRLRGENSDLFTPILPSEATIGLTSETNFKFLDLFTQDDRKYRIIAKTNGTEYWRGFIKPGLYQEQYYTDTNYYVFAEATDQLVLLKDLDFLDVDGNKIKGVNSLIKIIAFLLAKTDLDLPIRSCVNIFEIDMAQTATDDPLDQTHIDTETYYTNNDEPLSCYDVLENILLSFGSRLFQWEGYWYIVPVDSYTASIPYREFDVNGDYVTNGSFDPVFDIKESTQTVRACWANRSQNLEVRGAYGKSDCVLKLVKYPSAVLNGSFDDVDIEKKVRKALAGGGSEFTTKRDVIVDYTGWSLITNGNVANYYYANLSTGNTTSVDTLNPNYAGVIYSNSDSNTKGQDAYFLSQSKDIIYSESDAIVFKFDFYPDTLNIKNKYLPPVLKFKWRLQLGTYYLQADGSWTTDTDLQWVEAIVESSSFNTWQTIEIKTTCPTVTGEVSTTYQISLMHGSFMGDVELGCWDLASYGAIQALTTTILPLGYISWYVASNANYYDVYIYKLIKGNPNVNNNASVWGSATSGLVGTYYNILTPGDYDDTLNNVQWSLIQKISTDDIEVFKNDVGPKCAVRKFDNVSFELLPNNKKSPETFTYTTGNSTKIKDNDLVNVINGDVPNGISNAKNLYLNWYRYSDGTPTVQWNRIGVDESMPLLELLTKRRIELHNLPKFKLTGTLKTDTFFGFRSSFYESSSLKYFVPMSISINDLRCEYDVEIQEVGALTSTGIEDVSAFKSNAFTNGFNI